MPKLITKKPKQSVPFEHLSEAEFHAGMQEFWAEFDRMPRKKQDALFVEWDILNPDGTLRRYPMDHVPLGPRN